MVTRPLDGQVGNRGLIWTKKRDFLVSKEFRLALGLMPLSPQFSRYQELFPQQFIN
jgi:hypothetical protein